jgi:hypothetical protein
MSTKYLTDEEREKEIGYTAKNGIKFNCRRDLYNSIRIVLPKRWDAHQDKEALIAEATAEFMGWFMLETYPLLNGFAGYDCLRFDIEKTVLPAEQRGDWHFDRQSGFAGWRCRFCTEWVHNDKPKTCECDLIGDSDSTVEMMGRVYAEAEKTEMNADEKLEIQARKTEYLGKLNDRRLKIFTDAYQTKLKEIG